MTVAFAEEGADTSFGDALARHGAVLLAAARLITLDEAEAQDVVQATYEIALRRRNTLREPDSLRAWLLTIETREAIRRVGLMRRFLSLNPLIHDTASIDPCPDDALVLKAGMRALPRRVRAAIAMHYLEGYSVRETAAVLGVSENTIKTQIKKGLARLREELGDE